MDQIEHVPKLMNRRVSYFRLPQIFVGVANLSCNRIQEDGASLPGNGVKSWDIHWIVRLRNTTVEHHSKDIPMVLISNDYDYADPSYWGSRSVGIPSQLGQHQMKRDGIDRLSFPVNDLIRIQMRVVDRKIDVAV